MPRFERVDSELFCVRRGERERRRGGERDRRRGGDRGLWREGDRDRRRGGDRGLWREGDRGRRGGDLERRRVAVFLLAESCTGIAADFFDWSLCAELDCVGVVVVTAVVGAWSNRFRLFVLRSAGC